MADAAEAEDGSGEDSEDIPTLSSSERQRRTRDSVEAALSDVILLGTEEQVRLAAQAAQDMVAGRAIETAPLVASLRQFIRAALDLEPIPAHITIPNQGPTRSSTSGGNARRATGAAGGTGAATGGGRAGGGGGAAAGGMAWASAWGWEACAKKAVPKQSDPRHAACDLCAHTRWPARPARAVPERSCCKTMPPAQPPRSRPHSGPWTFICRRYAGAVFSRAAMPSPSTPPRTVAPVTFAMPLHPDRTAGPQDPNTPGDGMPSPPAASTSRPPARWRQVLEVFVVFLQLGLTSFGGPAAHLGYFRTALCSGANGSATRNMQTWWRCASSCPARPAAR
jgi:hypothetical protein